MNFDVMSLCIVSNVLLSELNGMPCRPPRQRVLIADSHSTTAVAADNDDDNAGHLPSITTDIDLSDHPLGASTTV